MKTRGQKSVVTLLQRANEMLSQQRLTEAVDLYRLALKLNPRLAATHFNLGNAWMSLNRWQDAIASYRESIRLEPNLAAAYSNLGHAFTCAGQLAEAANCYRHVLTLQPPNPIALSNLANALNDQGIVDEAITLYRQALELQPDHFASWNNLGNALCRNGELDQAINCFQRALQLMPDSAVTFCNLGAVLRSQKRFDDAIICCCKAIELKPDYAEAFCQLGEILKRQLDVDQALACFKKALELKPDFFEAHNGLGGLLHTLGKLDEAVCCFERALELRPTSVEATHSLGNVLKELGQIEPAVARYQRVLELDPQSAGANCNLGVAMLNQGRCDEAVGYFGQAMKLNPDDAAAHSNLLYSMQYRDGVTLTDLAEAHRGFEQQHAARFCPDICARRIELNHDRPLRLGFVSADFGRHPIGYFLTSTLQHLPRNKFETSCFSDRVRLDDMTLRMQAAATKWHDVRLLDPDQLAQLIRSERIDILFDLSGHTSGNRLTTFARKPAPIQITWAGYVGTTGLKQMDYILADRFEIPVGFEQYYQERVLRMPDGYVCYTPPVVSPAVTPLPALNNGHITFACFNNPAKLSPRITDVWPKILQRLPDSQLILKYKGWNDPCVAQRFVERFAPAVDPRRIMLLGPSSHLDLLSEYNRVDIALDSFPYSGGLTTCEALWMGVPVVTCPGETFAGRHSLTHLHNIGLTETIARDLDDYVERTIALASDLNHLAQLRSGLREQTAASPLCDAKRFAANLGKLLLEVFYESRIEPDQIAA